MQPHDARLEQESVGGQLCFIDEGGLIEYLRLCQGRLLPVLANTAKQDKLWSRTVAAGLTAEVF